MRKTGRIKTQAIGYARAKLPSFALGAVVDMLTVTVDCPLPDEICGGLKLQEANAGKPEHDTVKLFGNAPVFGLTATLKVAVLPCAIATLRGVADIVKSNV
jgi:hypothetical protein